MMIFYYGVIVILFSFAEIYRIVSQKQINDSPNDDEPKGDGQPVIVMPPTNTAGAQGNKSMSCCKNLWTSPSSFCGSMASYLDSSCSSVLRSATISCSPSCKDAKNKLSIGETSVQLTTLLFIFIRWLIEKCV